MQIRKFYFSDLTNSEWKLLEPQLPALIHHPKGGRPPKDRREIINGIRYVLRTGCAWRHMPHDLPKWGTCYDYFRKWKKDGTWKKIHDELRGDLREKVGRHREPSAAIIDSQSVKTTEKGGFMVMMQVKKSMEGKDIYWLT